MQDAGTCRMAYKKFDVVSPGDAEHSMSNYGVELPSLGFVLPFTDLHTFLVLQRAFLVYRIDQL